MEQEDQQLPQERTPQEQPAQREFRGLYKHVHVSVKTLDRVIIGCVIVIVIAMILGMQDPGYRITFDSLGGTPVEACKVMYGDPIPEPTPPTREGFTFTGWYRDVALTEKWNFSTDTVGGEFQLFAGWAEKTP